MYGKWFTLLADDGALLIKDLNATDLFYV